MGSASALPRLLLAAVVGLAPAAARAGAGRATGRGPRLDTFADQALAARRTGHPAEALAIWRRALAVERGRPGWPHAAYEVATRALDLGRPAGAAALLRRVAFDHPGAIDAPRALRFLAFRHPAPARAVWYLEAARRLAGTPLEAEALFRCGEAARAARQWGQALACYRRVIRRHATAPMADVALLHAADVYRAVGNRRAAEALYTWEVLGPPGLPKGEGPFPTHLAANALFALGRLKANDDPTGALAAWRRLLADHPTSRLCDDALDRIARLESRLGRRGAARAAWRRLLRTHPESRYAPAAKAALR